MSSLLATAEGLLIDRILCNDAPFTGKSKTGLGLFALAGVLLTIALGFFIYAAYLWLVSNYPPEIAAAAAGGLTLGVAALCALGAYGFLQYKRSRLKKLKNEIADTMQNALEFADEELAQPVKDNPKTAVLIASLAGFIAGEKFI